MGRVMIQCYTSVYSLGFGHLPTKFLKKIFFITEENIQSIRDTFISFEFGTFHLNIQALKVLFSRVCCVL